MCILQEESTFALQRVAFKMSFVNGGIRHAEAVFSLLRHHQTFTTLSITMRSGLVSTSMPLFRNRKLVPREDFLSKRDCLERQGSLLFPDSDRVADMGTPIVRSSAINFTANTSITSRVSCVVHVVYVLSSSFSEMRHPSGHDISARGRGSVICRGFCGVQGNDQRTRLFRTDANDSRRCEINRPLPTSMLRFRTAALQTPR